MSGCSDGGGVTAGIDMALTERGRRSLRLPGDGSIRSAVSVMRRLRVRPWPGFRRDRPALIASHARRFERNRAVPDGHWLKKGAYSPRSRNDASAWPLFATGVVAVVEGYPGQSGGAVAPSQ